MPLYHKGMCDSNQEKSIRITLQDNTLYLGYIIILRLYFYFASSQETVARSMNPMIQVAYGHGWCYHAT